MRSGRVKNTDSDGGRLSRRGFLRVATATSLAALLPPPRGRGAPPGAVDVAGDGGAGLSTQPVNPWWMRCASRSRVVDVRAPGAVHGWVIDAALVLPALDLALRTLTGEKHRRRAWRAILGSARRIVLKFNGVGARVIRTSGVLGRLLVEQIRAAGYDAEPLLLAELPEDVIEELGCAPVARGWGGTIRVGDFDEPLARYVLEADAIVNVAFLKTHQIAGLSGCMKNISHAVIRHPARFHANGCSPYVGQVISSEAVSSRLRLNLCNALRIVYRRGPEAREEDISAYGGLLVGFDPVAVDYVGLSILEGERRRNGMEQAVSVPYLTAAARSGLGRAHPADIERVALETRS